MRLHFRPRGEACRRLEKATPGSGDNDYVVNTLTIGGIVYTKAQLIAIMEAPTAGNGLMSLVQQLIAAKLNVLSGADDSNIAQAVIDTDKMIHDPPWAARSSRPTPGRSLRRPSPAR